MRNIIIGDKVEVIVGGTDCGEAVVVRLSPVEILVDFIKGNLVKIVNSDNVELVKVE